MEAVGCGDVAGHPGLRPPMQTLDFSVRLLCPDNWETAMYTLEIAGIAIATTDADEAEAREIFESEDFLDDIRGFTSAGSPVWDGVSAFVIRQATEDEIDAFSEIDDIEDDIDGEEGDEFDEEGANIMFLVDIDQFDDEEE